MRTVLIDAHLGELPSNNNGVLDALVARIQRSIFGFTLGRLLAVS
jgi:hypothetical protein